MPSVFRDNAAKILGSLTPAAACGIAIICAVLGVFAAQLAARAWRAADDAAPRAGDSELVRVHARGSRDRARAMAEAYQLSATVLLAVAAAIALYAIVPGLPAEGIGAIAIAGGLYLIADAFLSARAEVRSVTDEEEFNAFNARSPGLDPDAALAEFALERPGPARRLEHKTVNGSD